MILDYLTGLYNSHSDMFIQLLCKVFLAIVVLLSSYGASFLSNRSIERANNRFDKIDETLIPMLKTVLSIIIYILCGVVILDIFGFNTASIITLLGAAGLAVGLALKDTLGNIASGIMLLILRPFRVGHYIECGAVAGSVIQVTLFATILETADGINISAPNSSLWGVPIKNFTVSGKRRMDITVGIGYWDSIDEAFKVLLKIAENEKRFLNEPAPQVILSSMLVSRVNVQLRAWTTTDDYWETFCTVNMKIKEQIEAAALIVSLPQMDVNVVEKQAVVEK